MITFRLFLSLLCMLFLGACKEDYSYPNVLTELAEVKTDNEGRLKQLTTDNGSQYAIKIQSAENKFRPDTTYRMLTVFELFEGPNHPLKVYSAHPVFSKIAQPESFFKEGIKTDPVDIQSIWQSGNYLNFILHVQVKDKPHQFHFVFQGIKNEPSANREKESKILEFSFYHDRKQDFEAFTAKYCFSIPLKPYEQEIEKGDKIRIYINTYKEGMVIREFNFTPSNF